MKEAPDYSGMQKYYLGMGMLFGALSLYCLVYVQTWGIYTCVVNDERELKSQQAKGTYCLSNATPARRNLELTIAEAKALQATSCLNGLLLVEGASSTVNATGMFIFYAIQAVLSIIVWSGMCCFARYLPTETKDLNCCIRLFGGLVRFFMKI